jgi:hypothetical protein
VVYAAGVVQGIALVTFPAASTILTDPAEYDLSSTQYSALFLPQVITAIAGALLGAGLASRYGTKRLYLAGLGAGLVSMTLLIVSAFLTEDQAAAFALLLLATASLGAGFGLTVPALNTLAAAFHPAGAGRAILVLNALLGLGTVLAPRFVLAGSFAIIALLPDDEPALGVLAFGLVGLGCSALLPLTISFGQKELTAISAAVAGGVIAFYQLGYGIAAFGVGPLLEAGVDLPEIYASAAVVALVLGTWSFVIAGRLSSPASLHPHLGHPS